MKLACDDDDRVAGKVFKLRCKRCSHVIIVRGTEVVDGEQVGPFERAELARRRDAGATVPGPAAIGSSPPRRRRTPSDPTTSIEPRF